MGNLDAEAIIAEEGLSETPVTDDVEEKKDETAGDGDKASDKQDTGDSTDKTTDKADDEEAEKPKPGDVIKPEEKKPDEEAEPEKPAEKKEEPAKPVETGPSASDKVDEAKSFMSELNSKGYQVHDDKGNIRDFEEVVPAGKYLAAQLNPIKVTDKEGKAHEFLLISDLEKAFPDGFEAKNNIEQMKLERGLMSNENKFEQAVEKYNGLKSTYEQEVGQVASVQERNTNYGNEYRAMAEAGLVPKAEGDLKDANNPAIKELGSILAWMNTKNEENKAKGLGEITSLWVAKQLMGTETPEVKVDPKEEKKKEIVDQRKKVASLTTTHTPSKGDDTVRRQYSSNANQLASQIIEEYGLK
jgi:hypothetical protein